MEDAQRQPHPFRVWHSLSTVDEVVADFTEVFHLEVVNPVGSPGVSLRPMNAVDGLTIESIRIPADAVTADDFADFYAAHRDSVFRAVLLATRHTQRAEDAVQEAFMRAYARWDTVRELDRPRAWVVRVALNVSTSWWRRLRRERSNPPDRPAHPDERPIDGELVRLVWELPLRQRQVVALRVLADLSIADTAEILGVAEGTVKAQLHRALRKLRATLEATGGDR